MKFAIQVLIESPDTLPLSIPFQTIERSFDQIENRLEEAKAILSGLQEQLVRRNSQTISRGTDPVRVAIDHDL